MEPATSAQPTPLELYEKRLRAARWLAKQGFGIVLLPTPIPGDCGCPPSSSTREGGRCKSPGKHPLGKDWEHHAAHDAASIDALTSAKPHLRALRQFGVFVEPGSRLLIIDEDAPGKLQMLCDSVGIAVPVSFGVLTSLDKDTGERKRHLYLRLPEGYDLSSVPKTWIGGEIRVDGSGQVVGPWSLHASGLTYEPFGPAEIAECPAELLDALRKTTGERSRAQTVAAQPGEPGFTIHQGEGRHEFMLQTARHLWKGGIRGEALVEQLVKIDQERCSPPYGRAEMARLADWGEKNLEEPWVPIRLNVPGAPHLRIVGADESAEPEGVAYEVAKPLDFPEPPAGEAFQGLAGSVVDQMTDFTDASPAGMLTSLLTMWSGVFGADFTLYNERQPSNLFMVLVGATAMGRKGTATRLTWQTLMDVLQPGGPNAAGVSLWDARWDGMASGQGFLRHMSTAAVKRGVAVEEEFENVIRLSRSSKDYASILATTLQKGFDGSLIQSVTVAKTVTVAPPYFVSILGNITGEVLREVLPPTMVTGGFANRVGWVPVRATGVTPPRMGDRLELMPATEEALQKAMQARLAGTFIPPTVGPKAQARVSEYFEWLQTQDPRFARFTPRLHVIAARIAFVHAMLDRSKTVTPDLIDRGIALTEYTRSSLPWVFSGESGDEDLDLLMDMIRAKPEGLTSRERRAVWKDPAREAKIMRRAIIAGMVEEAVGAPGPKGGRPQRLVRASGIVGAGLSPRFVGGFVEPHARAGGGAQVSATPTSTGEEDEKESNDLHKPPSNPQLTLSLPSTMSHQLVCSSYHDHQTTHSRAACGSFHCPTCSPADDGCPTTSAGGPGDGEA